MVFDEYLTGVRFIRQLKEIELANSKLKCKWCKEYKEAKYFITVPGGRFCSLGCVHLFIDDKRERNRLKAIVKAYGKRQPKAKKKELMTRSQWYNRLQTLVNQYVTKVRDVGKPCCTCGTTNNIKFDAGHLFTKKARPDIRFDLKNIHIQCSIQCNMYGSGMRHEYKKFIVETYGPLELIRLERVGRPLKEQFRNWQDIETEIIRYRAILRDNGIKPNV